jgi:hypothetical protein
MQQLGKSSSCMMNRMCKSLFSYQNISKENILPGWVLSVTMQVKSDLFRSALANPTDTLKRYLERVIDCARNAKACEERVCGIGIWQKREDLSFRSCLSGS